MPTSHFAAFPVTYETENGVKQSVGAGVDVIASDGVTDLDTFTTDSDGLIDGDTLDVAAGTRVFFRIEEFGGMAGSIAQITT